MRRHLAGLRRSGSLWLNGFRGSQSYRFQCGNVTSEPFTFIVAGREAQLERLRASFANALNGKPQVVLLSGNAGAGKTVLIREFCKQVQRSNANVVVACGQCAGGRGDPYLPFIEIARLLTGDVAGDLGPRIVDHTNAQRLKNIGVTTAEIMVEVGGDLVGIFVPGADLLERVVSVVGKALGIAWIPHLKKQVENPSSREGFKPEQFFEQFSRVLSTLATTAPLILTVDDLHWADNGSLELLFYLARRLRSATNLPILLLGTYRPAEIRLGRDGGRHPLEGIVNEVRRYWPDAEIDLEKAQGGETGLAFVEALVDTEPNRLDADFRMFLFRRTDGHPLFTVEILRMLKQRGTLVKDSDDRWVLVQPITLEELPDSVEAVIEERIQRLERQLRDILTCGSVEGERFTAEIIARVRQVEEMKLADQLNDELEKRHFLVVSTSEVRAAQKRLHTYRFIHAIFQQYVYENLSEMQRQQLHRAVGETLEALYADNAAMVAAQLARHFNVAGEDERAIKYLMLAGDQAATAYANADALRQYLRARQVIARSDGDRTVQQYRLACSLARIYARQGRPSERLAEISRMLQLAEALGDKKKVGEAHIFQSAYFIGSGDYLSGRQAADEALMVLNEINDEQGAAEARLALGEACEHLARHDEALQHLRAAADMFQHHGNRTGLADAVRLQALVHLHRNDYPEALAQAEQAVALYKQSGDRIGEDEALRYIGDIHHARGEYEEALEVYESVLRIRRQIGNRAREGGALGDMGDVHLFVGNYQESLELHCQSLAIDEEVGYRYGQAWCHHDIGVIRSNLAEWEAAQRELQLALALAVELPAPDLIVLSKNDLSRVMRLSGDERNMMKARELAGKAIATAVDGALISGQIIGHSNRAMANLLLANKTEAWEESQTAIALLEDYPDAEVLPEEIYWNHASILLAMDEAEGARRWLEKAQETIEAKGNKIRDRFFRESYFTRVPLNREILAARQRLSDA